VSIIEQAFTFLFYEDVEQDNDGNICTNRHASQDTFFAKKGEEKKTATFSNVSNVFRYLDSNESAEGCPSKRFVATLERKVTHVIHVIVTMIRISKYN
jgi:hypothetical protein